MALSQRLEFRQTQQLVMTPQLQQAIKLLQYNNLELSAYVDQELEQNPLLERSGEADSETDAGEFEPANTGDSADLGPLNDGSLDTDYSNLYNDGSAASADAPSAQADGADSLSAGAAFDDWGGGGSRSFDDELPDLEQRYAEAESLRDHLNEQVNTAFTDSGDRLIALYLIDMIDGAGYLPGDTATQLAEQLTVPGERVEAVRQRLLAFDPTGICAATVRECLGAQLAERNRLDPAMAALLDNLGLIESGEFAKLKARCGVDGDDLQDMLAELRTLDPRPAQAYTNDVAQTVAPDIFLRPGRDGGWLVELNQATLPRVLVNTPYYTQVQQSARTKAERQFLSERFAAANWLVKSLHQRANTILRVAEAIVAHQEGFFTHGIAHLRPLVLRDIAEEVGMHESTVSRVTANKYMATPRGMFELKYFFTSAIQATGGGEAVASEAVKSRIKAMIEDEAPGKVLSDERIAQILRDDGIDIARRTVAKYRETLGFASSSRRRRQKARRLAI